MSLHQFALGAASASAAAAAEAVPKRRKSNSSVCSLNGLATASGDTSKQKRKHEFIALPSDSSDAEIEPKKKESVNFSEVRRH